MSFREIMKKTKLKYRNFHQSREIKHFLYCKLYQSVLLSMSMTLPFYSTQVFAQETTNLNTDTQLFKLAQNDLSTTLLLYSEQSGVQVIAPSNLIQGKISQAVHGRYTAAQALKLLLSNTSLNVQFTQQHTAIITASPTQGTHLLGAVKVQGSLDSSDTNSHIGGISSQNLSPITGVNGSRDATATEGNNSYARGNVSIDGHSIKDAQKIAQSISTVNHQQLVDQKAITLKDALKNAAGINFMLTTGGNPIFYSRGFEIKNYTVDGSPVISGSPSDSNNYGRVQSLNDMSLYDHVEVLRGSDAFLNQGNNSNPGGSVNMVRKKPLDHQQYTTELALGSWNNRRISVDATGPLTVDGRLKGRIITTSIDKDEFWRNGRQQKNLVAGDLQYDFSPDTIVGLGYDYGRITARPMETGIPFGRQGEDLFLDRSFSMIVPWAKTSTLQKGLRFNFDHNFNENWSYHLKAKSNWGDSNYLESSPSLGGLTSSTKTLSLDQSLGNATQKNYGIESSLLGKIALRRLEQNFELSAQHFSNRTDSVSQFTSFEKDNIDFRTMDYNTIPRPSFESPARSGFGQYSYGSVYLKLDLQPFESFHILTGPRWNYSRSKGSRQDRTDLDKSSVPYYALRYDWNKNWSSYASYTDIYQIQSNYLTSDGSSLPPLTGSTKEIGVKYSNNAKTLTASLAVYDTTRKNILDYSRNEKEIPDCCFVVASKKEKSRGIDFEITGMITPHWETNLSYAYNHNYRDIDSDTGEEPPLMSEMPEHTLKVTNTIRGWGNPVLEKLRAGLSLNYISKEYTQDARSIDPNQPELGFEGIQMTQAGHSVADIFIAYDISKNLKAQLNYNNIFDKRYYTNIGGILYGSWYGEPRNLLFTLQAKF